MYGMANLEGEMKRNKKSVTSPVSLRRSIGRSVGKAEGKSRKARKERRDLREGRKEGRKEKPATSQSVVRESKQASESGFTSSFLEMIEERSFFFLGSEQALSHFTQSRRHYVGIPDASYYLLVMNENIELLPTSLPT